MTNFQFLAVDQGNDLDRDKFSGIIGLSPNLVGAKNLNGFLNQVQSNKVIDPVFSFYLTKNEKPGSTLTFGGYNIDKFAKDGLKESDVKWFDSDKENMQYWSIPMGGD